MFSDKCYEEKDGVSMGSQLGPVLANIIMAELEQKSIRKFVEDGTVKFYGRFVDDALVIIKPTLCTNRINLLSLK